MKRLRIRIDGTLTGTTNPDQSGPGSNCKKGATPHSPKVKT